MKTGVKKKFIPPFVIGAVMYMRGTPHSDIGWRYKSTKQSGHGGVLMYPNVRQSCCEALS
jgi:hypothetical protein